MANCNTIHSTHDAEYCKIKPIAHTRTADEYCFQISGICIWNDLPFNITSLKSFNNFKTKRFEHLTNTGLF